MKRFHRGKTPENTQVPCADTISLALNIVTCSLVGCQHRQESKGELNVSDWV